MNLPYYLQIVRRNIILIVLSMAVLVGLAAYQNSGRPKVYESSGQVLLRPENLPNDPTSMGNMNRVDAFRFANVEAAVIDSASVAAEAARDVPGSSPEEILGGAQAVLDENGAIITVSATSRDPAKAAAIANAVIDTYVEQRRRYDVGAIEDAVEEFEERLQALATRIEDLESATEGAAPAADLVATREQYAAVFARQQDLLVQASLQRPTAEVLQRAEIPFAPIGLGLTTKAILAALLGGVIGLGLAFAREQLDDRVRSRDEVQSLLGMAVLAELPVDRRSARSESHVSTGDEPLGPLAEKVRGLRTSIGFLSVDQPRGIRQLLITSTVPGDGKTLVAANLGVAYAQAGHRTVMVSADLRRPRLERMFGLAPGAGWGLSDAFALDGPSRDVEPGSNVARAVDLAVRATRFDGLWLLPAGGAVPNPAELLSSSRMDELLQVLGERYDMVIVDSSPLLAVTDAAALAPKVGHVLVVASMQQTHRRALVRAAETVHAAHAKVLGVVLNKASTDSASYGAGYGPLGDTARERAEGAPVTKAEA